MIHAEKGRSGRAITSIRYRMVVVSCGVHGGVCGREMDSNLCQCHVT